MAQTESRSDDALESIRPVRRGNGSTFCKLHVLRFHGTRGVQNSALCLREGVILQYIELQMPFRKPLWHTSYNICPETRSSDARRGPGAVHARQL